MAMETPTDVVPRQTSVWRTLRQQVLQDDLPSAATATTKRVHDLHITAYPSTVNYTLLSERARAARDVATAEELATHRDAAPTRPGDVRAALSTMTTNGLAAKMREMGIAMRTSRANPGAALSAAPPHTLDRRTTYRLDYTVDDAVRGAHDASATQKADYRASWSEDEKRNVDVSMRLPYLTLPETCTRDRTTIYRRELIPTATAQEFRTVHHKLPRDELGLSFAYSAYAVEDGRRKIGYDATVAALRAPRSALPHASTDRVTLPTVSGGRKEQTEELERLRTLRRAEAARASRRRAPETSAEGLYDSFGPVNKPDYIYLPRDAFCPRMPSYL